MAKPTLKTAIVHRCNNWHCETDGVMRSMKLNSLPTNWIRMTHSASRSSNWLKKIRFIIPLPTIHLLMAKISMQMRWSRWSVQVQTNEANRIKPKKKQRKETSLSQNTLILFQRRKRSNKAIYIQQQINIFFSSLFASTWVEFGMTAWMHGQQLNTWFSRGTSTTNRTEKVSHK